MSKKELKNTGAKPDKKLRTKELIYAGAFGALYIVLMLIVVLGTSMIPILYILAPISVGLVCGTVYMLCVLKVRKFGAALILGVLFALTSCSGDTLSAENHRVHSDTAAVLVCLDNGGACGGGSCAWNGQVGQAFVL